MDINKAKEMVLEALKSGRPRRPDTLRKKLYELSESATHPQIRTAIWDLLEEGKIVLTVRLKLRLKK